MKRFIRRQFNVSPRYSPGSPAAVDYPTAKKVIEDEKTCAQHAAEGFYGEIEQAVHQRMGLRGIVWVVMERGKFVYIHDLITEELFEISNKIYAGPNWTAWGRQTPEQMEKYLYRGDLKSQLRFSPHEVLNAAT